MANFLRICTNSMEYKFPTKVFSNEQNTSNKI